MAFWGKKKMFDAVNKYFNERNVSVTNEYDLLCIELNFKDNGYNIYPYIKLDEENEQISIMVNIREALELKASEYEALNAFNLGSKYFTAKYKDNAIVLEYNSICNYDNVVKLLHSALESLFSKQNEIDNL